MTWGAVGLTVRYGRRTALSDVSVRVEPGMVTCVVGGDGAGKTTLLRALVGSAPITHGVVLRPAVAQIGYLSAGTGVYPDLTVRENLEFAARAYHVRDRHPERLLARTGLSGVDDRLGAELSGGMRQKLGVVLALLHRPQLLVLDEPTTGVDPASRAEIARLIAGAAADGAAVVFTTSYLDEAERAGEVLVLDGGTTLATGLPSKIVAAAEGQVWNSTARPARGFTWRRADGWRMWGPAGDASPIRPDLQDAVIVAALRHRQEAA